MYKALYKKSIIKFVIKKYFKIYDCVLQRAPPLRTRLTVYLYYAYV